MIRLENISKDYFVGNSPVHALKNINLTIDSGEFVAVTGPSGAGKSTLMSIIGCLDSPSDGSYLLNSNNITLANDDDLAILRRRYFGFVFQSFNLIPRLNVVQNIELPMIYSGMPHAVCLQRSHDVLKAVGLEELGERKPGQLSGGQQQRVAIARALVNNPPVIIADEPTGNLDSKKAQDVIELFELLNSSGKTILYVTHDQGLVRHANRVIRVDNGQVVEV